MTLNKLVNIIDKIYAIKPFPKIMVITNKDANMYINSFIRKSGKD